ncbi:transposon Tf2-1 polyprotein [Striga asiatica]|uniref:Transposon Tf2-1 polyprotein n=1 Tax=Striga asiatica TaxID=4170 RepID=A0A5A7P7U5_STRAF|nr:transposon Tf2-1 polyprotein [Striga asiatica]
MRTRSGCIIGPNDEPSHESVWELFDKLSLNSSETTNPDMALQHRDLLRDLAHPTIGPIISCIQLPQEARNYELKMIHYNQLPSLHGLPNEDPLNFIREFYNRGATEDEVFPETLKDRAKAWFMTLALDSLTTWAEVYTKFIGRYYSHQKTQELRSQIRFKDLQRQCPHHNLSPGLLINYFYDSLHQNLQYMVDNAAARDIGAKTTGEISRGKRVIVNEVEQGNNVMAQQLAKLTEQMRLLNARGAQLVQTMAIDTCGACGVPGHRSEVCPSAFDQEFGEQYADASALQGYQARPGNDPFSNTYNPRWRNHPSFSWSNNTNSLQQPRPNFMQQQPRPNFIPRPNYQQQQPRGPVAGMQALGSGPSSSLQDDKLDKILQFIMNQDASIKRLETQVGQLATRVGHMETESDKGKLPSQTEQAKAITVLRSGKVVYNKVQMPGPEDQEVTNEPESEGTDAEKINEGEAGKVTDDLVLHKSQNPFKPHNPFPDRLRNEKQEKQFRDLFSMLSKDGEKVIVYEAASAMQHDLPKKEREPGGFIIQIALGNGKRLGLGELKPTCMCLQLADRSIRYPKGTVEDVLVKVGKLIIPVDFVVLNVGDVHENGKDHTILLERPFMATTNTLIDVKNMTLNMTVLRESVSISIRGAMSASSVNFVEECAFIDLADPFVDEMVLHVFEEVSILVFEDEEEHIVELFEVREGHSRAEATLELKELLKHLKYVFLDDAKQKPMIIFAELDREEEEKLIAMLRKNQKAIGWSLGDITGISPSTCMHRIILEEGAKPFWDSQCQLNPNMMEVVKKEVLKLFSEGLIYPVASSEWVSPIHVVLQKGGITVVKNDKKELKDHFPLPFINQILDRLSGHQFYCFLDELSGYYLLGSPVPYGLYAAENYV